MTETTLTPDRATASLAAEPEAHVPSIPAALLATLLVTLDGILVIVTLVIAGAVNAYAGAGGSLWLVQALEVGLPAAAVFTVLSLSWGHYSAHGLLGRRRPFVCFVEAWLASFFLVGWVGFLTKTTADFSRLALTLSFFLGFVTVFAPRELVLGIVRQRVRSANLMLRTAFVLHTDTAAAQEKLNERLAREGVRIVGRASADVASLRRGDMAVWQAAVESCRAAFVRQPFDAIYLFLPWQDLCLFGEARPLFARLPVPVFLFPDNSVQRILDGRQLDTGSTTAFEVQRAPLSRAERWQKRALDLVLGTFLLVLLSPLIAMVALAILAQDGRPVFFRQRRNGFGGRPFAILKFRTMSVCEDGAEIRQAERNDRRVTPLGRVLRRTSVDELPQLINVLRGEMSLIGPRPHALAHDTYYDQLISTYAERQHVAPGITGWAQINGCRGETREFSDMVRRVDHDLWYIGHWSVALDLRILALTAVRIFDDTQAF